MAFKQLPTNYTDAVWSGLKRYQEINNEDGTVSFQDVTVYSNKENSFFGAKEANEMNAAINAIMAALEKGTDLYAAFEDYFSRQKQLFNSKIGEFESEQKQAFETWWQGLKQWLKTEDVGRLLSDLQEYKEDVENAKIELADSSLKAKAADQLSKSNLEKIKALENKDINIRRVNSLGNVNKDGIHLQLYNPYTKEWEWLNPPLLNDKEYLIYDKSLGYDKKIYIKSVNFGQLANNASKEVTYYTGEAFPIEVSGFLIEKGKTTPQYILPINNGNSSQMINLSAVGNKINIRSYQAWPNHTAKVIVKYTR